MEKTTDGWIDAGVVFAMTAICAIVALGGALLAWMCAGAFPN